MMCLKDSIHQSRFSFADWIEKRGMDVVELGVAGRSLFLAFLVTTQYQGRSLAPFLETALWSHSTTSLGAIFACLLMAAGLFQFAALAIGTHCRTYLLRFIASLFNFFVSIGIVAALIRGPQPPVIALQYAWSAFLILICVLHDWVKHTNLVAHKSNQGCSGSEDAADSR